MEDFDLLFRTEPERGLLVLVLNSLVDTKAVVILSFFINT